MTITADQLQEILGPISSAFPNWHPTADTYSVYAYILADLPEPALKMAVWRALSSSREFAPSAGQLRALACEVLEEATDTAIPTAYEAWQQVLDHWHGNRTHHELVETAVRRFGGWDALGQSTNQVSDRARFIEDYEGLRARAVERQRLPAAVKAHLDELQDTIAGLLIP